MRTIRQHFLIAFLALLLAACGGAGNGDAGNGSSANGAGIAETGSGAATEPPRSTAPPLAAPVLIEPTATATSAATAVPTPVPATPTPLGADIPPPLPPIDPANLPLPPYVASDCSDKYPCNEDVAAWEARIGVPDGFKVTYFAHLEGHPTALTAGPDGLIYVANQEGAIYTVDGLGQVRFFLDGFISPTGLAFRPGTADLYVASRVIDDWSGLNGEAQISLVRDGAASAIITGLPCCYTGMHAANAIAFGPDGFGYVGVGARGDHGEHTGADGQPEIMPLEAGILRFSPDGSQVERFAGGLRNPYGIAWDGRGNLFATDNAPDYGPPDELHRVIPGGQHGYPYYECDVCTSAPAGTNLINPIYNFMPHSSPTGMTAYLGDQFPGYRDSLFVTLWSSFEGAQKIMHFEPGGGEPSDFAVGLAAPIDVIMGVDGALYVVDWATGILFQIAYAPA